MLKKVVKSSEIDEVTAKSKISANKEWTDFNCWLHATCTTHKVYDLQI